MRLNAADEQQPHFFMVATCGVFCVNQMARLDIDENN